MHSLFTFTTPAHECAYLPDRAARMQYEIVAELSAAEYEQKLITGWRHFGRSLFRPRCRSCTSCQSLRIIVDEFQPSRSQQRAWKANADITLTITEPSVTNEKLQLYDRFHQFQVGFKNWPDHPPKDSASYTESFVENPFPVQEWQFRSGDRLIGIGYVDAVPHALSAIYFFYDPAERARSLGTFNVLKIIESAARLKLPFVYMGYYVAGCRSLEYKANFLPNQIMDGGGKWE